MNPVAETRGYPMTIDSSPVVKSGFSIIHLSFNTITLSY
jgi:hypothetical protein